MPFPNTCLHQVFQAIVWRVEKNDHSMTNEIDNCCTELGREIRVGYTEWDPEDLIPLSNFVKIAAQENPFSEVLITPDMKSKTVSIHQHMVFSNLLD
ncbi:unnamed protein product [Acanthoscelides obtectus]|uniref:Uncharacterized protein n=1 Tax=Acanthoscelides obtectus TaxID=200917 RepID=A0A9P0K164_ACAOB|nr:unnamed protein product [Acanthoscelides obtectus]CAK1623850.1 hypothetical protein AOBTE_LOCUS2215 [Acanthoscelides obtectus]